VAGSRAKFNVLWRSTAVRPYRFVVQYFARPHNDTVLIHIDNSLVLEAVGVKTRFEQPLTMEQWVEAK